MTDEGIYPISQVFLSGGGIVNFYNFVLIIIIYLEDARETL